MAPDNKLQTFAVNREDDAAWTQLISFMAANAISNGRAFTADHERAVREMLHFDIPRHITDARRIERWIYDNAANTLSRFTLFR